MRVDGSGWDSAENNESGLKRMEIDGIRLQMSGSEWEWIRKDESEWEWVEAGFSITLKSF